MRHTRSGCRDLLGGFPKLAPNRNRMPSKLNPKCNKLIENDVLDDYSDETYLIESSTVPSCFH